MRTRESNVNVRTTPQEKTYMQRNAKRCGLSLSEYLRKLANGYEPKSLPPLEYRELMNRITDLYVNFNEWGETQYADLLVGVLLKMQAAISPAKGGKHGND